MVEIRQTEAYSQWFNNLRDRQARARLDMRIRRLSLGNPGDVIPS
jgi:putative addiction module killer protein